VSVDPGRLTRALFLEVNPLGQGRWQVQGGAMMHQVRKDGDRLRCDCADAEIRGARCKHVLCVALSRLDHELLKALRVLVRGGLEAKARVRSSTNAA
jgi:hypothetical protein